MNGYLLLCRCGVDDVDVDVPLLLTDGMKTLVDVAHTINGNTILALARQQDDLVNIILGMMVMEFVNGVPQLPTQLQVPQSLIPDEWQ